MKLLTFLFLLLTASLLADSPSFNNYFLNATLRYDYYHSGSTSQEHIIADKMYRYEKWAGSLTQLIDHFNNGKYYVKLYDPASNRLIFSRGFDSFFGEYQSTRDAAAGIEHAFHETANLPFPKNKVRLVFESRDEQNKLQPVFETVIDPQDVRIQVEQPRQQGVKVITGHEGHRDAHRALDIAIIGEGYTEQEFSKFEKDLKKFSTTLINQQPFSDYKDQINIYGVFKASEESGVDEPRAAIYRKTVVNATFNFMGSERYLETEDNQSLRDLAANVPYDALYIMVNHKRYGGGGIYNLFCTFTTDNQWQEYLFLHEFGHSFAGLADEYYTSASVYDSFYKSNLEPIEPNITALPDPQHVKWSALLTPGIELPSKWGKEAFDKMDYAWQAKRQQMNNHTAALKKQHASVEEITEAENAYESADKIHSQKVDEYLQSSGYYGKVGAFEGAGYMAKGLYRPQIDCIMFSKGKKPFCAVCEAHIVKVIRHYIE